MDLLGLSLPKPSELFPSALDKASLPESALVLKKSDPISGWKKIQKSGGRKLKG